MSGHDVPHGSYVGLPHWKQTAEALNARIEAEMASARRVTFLGIAEGGRRLNLAYGDGPGRIIRFFNQAELRQRETQEELFGVDWLRTNFPRYERASVPEGGHILITTDYDDHDAAIWAISRCFEAAGYMPPDRISR